MKNVQQIVNLSQSNIIDIRHNEMNNAEKTNLQVVEATVGWIPLGEGIPTFGAPAKNLFGLKKNHKLINY